jgi:hypothetical protein
LHQFVLYLALLGSLPQGVQQKKSSRLQSPHRTRCDLHESKNSPAGCFQPQPVFLLTEIQDEIRTNGWEGLTKERPLELP